jgi:hypothetical protein
MDELPQRAARGLALATLAVACVVVGPAPQLTRAFERTYAVAVVEDARRRRAHTDRVPAGTWRRRSGPRPVGPGARRP